MAQESIPAKSTKDLEFCKYIIENILNNFGKHASRKRQKKHFVLNSTRWVLKSGTGNIQILWSLSVHLISVI